MNIFSDKSNDIINVTEIANNTTIKDGHGISVSLFYFGSLGFTVVTTLIVAVIVICYSVYRNKHKKRPSCDRMISNNDFNLRISDVLDVNNKRKVGNVPRRSRNVSYFRQESYEASRYDRTYAVPNIGQISSNTNKTEVASTDILNTNNDVPKNQFRSTDVINTNTDSNQNKFGSTDGINTNIDYSTNQFGGTNVMKANGDTSQISFGGKNDSKLSNRQVNTNKNSVQDGSHVSSNQQMVQTGIIPQSNEILPPLQQCVTPSDDYITLRRINKEIRASTLQFGTSKPTVKVGTSPSVVKFGTSPSTKKFRTPTNRGHDYQVPKPSFSPQLHNHYQVPGNHYQIPKTALPVKPIPMYQETL